MIGRSAVRCLTLVAMLLAVVNHAQGCKVDGVIDWEAYQTHRKSLNDIAKDGWSKNGTVVGDYVAWDGDAFMAKANHALSDPLTFKVLAGAAVVEPRHNGEFCNVEIWAWVDVNRNRQADENDKILVNGQATPQSWKLVADMDLEVNRAWDVIPDAKVPGRDYYAYNYFHPGLCYLLLIRVYCGTTDSWSWHCLLNGNSDYLWVQTGSQEQTDWEPAGSKAYGDQNGQPLSPGVSWDGIDDWEILWIHFVAPASPPGPYGPRR